MECLSCTEYLHSLSVGDRNLLNRVGHPPLRVFWDRVFKSVTAISASSFPPPPHSLFSSFSFSQPISWSESWKRNLKSQLFHLLLPSPKTSYFPAFSHSFLLYKIGNMASPRGHSHSEWFPLRSWIFRELSPFSPGSSKFSSIMLKDSVRLTCPTPFYRMKRGAQRS